MSKITSPILLDTTGQDINGTLGEIRDALLSSNTLIDDTTTKANRVWSSHKITTALTVAKTESGATVVCSPIAATPVIVEVDVEEAIELELTQSANSRTQTYAVYIPVAGHFNFSTGNLETLDGNVVSLVGNAIVALEGPNTFKINVDSMDVTYRTVASGDGSSAPAWDVIFGGNAAEEV